MVLPQIPDQMLTNDYKLTQEAIITLNETKAEINRLLQSLPRLRAAGVKPDFTEADLQAQLAQIDKLLNNLQ